MHPFMTFESLGILLTFMCGRPRRYKSPQSNPGAACCMQIVQRLLAEVEAASAAMLEGLLAKLRGPIQLPECLRVVGCLRRLAAFPEPELRRRYIALSHLISVLAHSTADTTWQSAGLLRKSADTEEKALPTVTAAAINYGNARAHVSRSPEVRQCDDADFCSAGSSGLLSWWPSWTTPACMST